MSDLWSDKHKPEQDRPLDQTMSDMEYNLREDIHCLKEDKQELVSALRTFADETGTAERQLAFELVKRHGEK